MADAVTIPQLRGMFAHLDVDGPLILDCPRALYNTVMAVVAMVDREQQLHEAYKKRLTLMHGYEDAACPMDQVRAIVTAPGASEMEIVAALRFLLRQSE